MDLHEADYLLHIILRVALALHLSIRHIWWLSFTWAIRGKAAKKIEMASVIHKLFANKSQVFNQWCLRSLWLLCSQLHSFFLPGTDVRKYYKKKTVIKGTKTYYVQIWDELAVVSWKSLPICLPIPQFPHRLHGSMAVCTLIWQFCQNPQEYGCIKGTLIAVNNGAQLATDLWIVYLLFQTLKHRRFVLVSLRTLIVRISC